eukprot:Skav202933  [mRNA]  locus=scaffold422:14333:16830:+ [translate_table: standard]
MDAQSLYDVLLVAQTATLDEIKLAFKRRALQLISEHPNISHLRNDAEPGGSKEAFHSVYHALEILSDPEARRKYDVDMTGRPAGEQPQSRPVRKPSKKDGHNTTKTAQAARKAPKQKSGHVKREPTKPKGFQSKQNKLLTKIRDLLKKLPRAERNDVIANQFSQKQRLILEKWMVDAQGESQNQGGEEVGPFVLAEARQKKLVQAETEHPNRLSQGTSCALALPAVPKTTSSKKMIMQISASTCQARKRKTKKNKKKESEAKSRSKAGWIRKNRNCSSYEAGICFDAVELCARNSSDLQTSLDNLIFLTAVKQKMRSSGSTPRISFTERLQAALESSAFEHGKNLADLRLSFVLWIGAGFLESSTRSCRTPRVHSLEKLAGIRKMFEPFRQWSQVNTRARSIYWRMSPVDLQEMWDLYQQAVADAWALMGADSTALLHKIRASYAARSEFRNTQLQSWERGHMAMQDRNKHRPRSLRERSSLTPLEKWERKRMALEDRRNNRHGRKKRRVLRQRKVQRNARMKKDREERKQAQALIRKRLQEQRLRRESLRKRMRCDLTMDDILGDGQRAEKNRFSSARETC